MQTVLFQLGRNGVCGMGVASIIGKERIYPFKKTDKVHFLNYIISDFNNEIH